MNNEAQINCPKCGRSSQAGLTSCPQCGFESLSTESLKQTIKEKERIDCPKCGSSVPSSDTCSKCGYEYSTEKEGVGPFVFDYPAVDTAYKPSGKGNTSANVLMLIIGTIAGTISGSSMLYAMYSSGGLLDSINSNQLISMILDALHISFILSLINLGTPIIVGALLSYIIGSLAIYLKSRDTRSIKLVGFISGGLCFMAFFEQLNSNNMVLFISLSNFDFEAPGSITYYLILIYSFIVLVIFPGFWAVEIIKDKPFCEKCMGYMKKTTLGKIPIRFETPMMELLNSSQFDRLHLMLNNWSVDEKNYCEIELSHCDSCHEIGLISASTFQTRYVKKENSNDTKTKEEKYFEKKENRRIFSSILQKEDLSKILNEK